jgi:hypothetical protein
MKSSESKNAKKPVSFIQTLGKNQRSSRILPFLAAPATQFPSPKHSQDESYTNNLHFKKNLVKIGRPYQKLLTFGGLKTILPHCAIICF